ncbi:MAG: pirin family protein [Alcaligenaceae bacterium]|nr:pirin family protein [Alcaligenaceae bacterium]
MSKITKSRQVEQIFRGQETSDGAGVKLTRLLSSNLQRRLDPFLMLDSFGSDNPDDYIAGFPNHPHRGFETVTYMIEGRMLHRDSKGNEGLLENGGVQWMTAGRGLIHSEIPQQEDGMMRGFQLWLNLSAQDKMIDPWYQDYQNLDLPKYGSAEEGVQVTVIAGQSHGTKGAVQREKTEPIYLDVTIAAGQHFDAQIPASHNAFIVVYEGGLEANGSQVTATQLALLTNDPAADGISLKATEDCRVLVIAGKPLNEPIFQHGPFVMNTKDEIIQAFNDYQAGLFA